MTRLPDDPDLADLADLELSPAQMRAMGQRTVERLIQHVAALPDQPASVDMTGIEQACRALREPPPEEGSPFDPLLDQVLEQLVPRSFTASGPGYLAYIPGGGLFPAAIADLIQGVTNRYTGVWQAAPLLVQLEANVLEWFRQWMGFPATTRGLLTTGGSMATFNAVVCARERLLGSEIRRGVLYASSQAHHSVTKAARLAGIADDRVRIVGVDAALRMDPADLTRAVAQDRDAGLTPFMVVSTAGTTNTGAVDPLETIADVCRDHALWHHVDGAYGAFFHLSPWLRPTLVGLSRADSLTLDPHKGLFLPYGTGALLVRDGAALRAVHRVSAGYLPDAPDDEFYDPSQYSPDLSRGFPGLRVWLCIKLFGVRKLRAAIEEKHRLACEAAAQLERLPGIRLLAPPALSLFALHLTWVGASLAQENEATGELLARVNALREVLLTGCTLDDGRFLARVCILSFRTRRERVQTCVEHIARSAAACLARV